MEQKVDRKKKEPLGILAIFNMPVGILGAICTIIISICYFFPHLLEPQNIVSEFKLCKIDKLRAILVTGKITNNGYSHAENFTVNGKSKGHILDSKATGTADKVQLDTKDGNISLSMIRLSKKRECNLQILAKTDFVIDHKLHAECGKGSGSDIIIEPTDSDSVKHIQQSEPISTKKTRWFWLFDNSVN